MKKLPATVPRHCAKCGRHDKLTVSHAPPQKLTSNWVLKRRTVKPSAVYLCSVCHRDYQRLENLLVHQHVDAIARELAELHDEFVKGKWG